MKIKKKYLFLTAILLVAALLRLYKLGSIPPHLTPDEAALGYNAYSILKTGKDEHGQVLPIIFKSFGDYKPGLYIYATIPFVATLGLNEYAVRLPGAISGILSVVLIYFISLELFATSKKLGHKRKSNDSLALLSSLFLAISPWHLLFSRGAWEISLALTLTLGGVLAFLKARKDGRLIVLSAALFALSTLAYQGAKLSTTLVVFLLLVCYFKTFIKIPKKYLLIAAVTALLISAPILLSMLTGRAGRLGVLSIFAFPRPDEYVDSILSQGDEARNGISYYLFHSEVLSFKRAIVSHWFNHFSGRFLFFEGDWSNPRHTIPYSGLLTLGDLPLLVLGSYAFLRKRLSKGVLFVFLWLLLAPLPAVLSRDEVQAVRSFNLVIPLTFLIAAGAYYLIDKLKRKKLLLLVPLAIYFAGFIYILNMYFVHIGPRNSQFWQYGFKQAVQTLTPYINSGRAIVFEQSFSQPYIYFLFYTKYDPALYQTKAATNYREELQGDVGLITKLDNITFEKIDWQMQRGRKGSLVAASLTSIPREDSQESAGFKLIEEIPYLNLIHTSFRIIEIQP